VFQYSVILFLIIYKLTHRQTRVVKFPGIQSFIQLIFSGRVWWCCSLQFSVQTVHHKQEVDFKHWKQNIWSRNKHTFSKT